MLLYTVQSQSIVFQIYYVYSGTPFHTKYTLDCLTKDFITTYYKKYDRLHWLVGDSCWWQWAMTTCSTRTQIFTTTTIQISTGTQHQYRLSVQQSSHDEHLQQVYNAIMRYSESVDKSGRWFEMMAMISVMLGYRAGAHHVLWGVDSGLGRVSTHRLCLYIIGWGWS